MPRAAKTTSQSLSCACPDILFSRREIDEPSSGDALNRKPDDGDPCGQLLVLNDYRSAPLSCCLDLGASRRLRCEVHLFAFALLLIWASFPLTWRLPCFRMSPALLSVARTGCEAPQLSGELDHPVISGLYLQRP